MGASARRTGLVLLVLGLIVATPTRPTRAEQTVIGDEPPHAWSAVAPLLADLESGDESRRVSAVMAMRELGPNAWPAVPILIEALSDPLVPVRKGAAGALGGIGPAAASAVPALRAALSDPHRFVRSWAAMALFEIGPGARAAGPELIGMLDSDAENLRGRSWCASALPVVGADPDRAVPALRRALESDPSEEVRAVAVLSLERYGSEAARRDGIHALIEALDDRHWKVRGNAACALPEMGPEAGIALSKLAVALRDEAPYVRGCAVAAIGELASLTEEVGARARELTPEVEALLADGDPDVRARAERALGVLRSER